MAIRPKEKKGAEKGLIAGVGEGRQQGETVATAQLAPLAWPCSEPSGGGAVGETCFRTYLAAFVVWNCVDDGGGSCCGKRRSERFFFYFFF